MAEDFSLAVKTFARSIIQRRQLKLPVTIESFNVGFTPIFKMKASPDGVGSYKFEDEHWQWNGAVAPSGRIWIRFTNTDGVLEEPLP